MLALTMQRKMGRKIVTAMICIMASIDNECLFMWIDPVACPPLYVCMINMYSLAKGETWSSTKYEELT